MKYLLISLSLFFGAYSIVFALDADASKVSVDHIENAHFTLSNIHELGYEVTRSQSKGLRNSYELESKQGCSIKMSTLTTSRDTTEEEEKYLSDVGLIPPIVQYKTKGKWKIKYQGHSMKKIFWHTNGIEAVSEGYPYGECHLRATNLIKKIIITNEHVYETNIVIPVGSIQGNYDLGKYIVGADMDSTFLTDFPNGFLGVISDHPRYWFDGVLLKNSLAKGDKIDGFVESGEVLAEGIKLTYIVLSSMENKKKIFTTVYVFPDEEVLGIIISSKTNNPRENLKSFLSVIQIQNDKQLSKAQKLPTLQEILEQEHILSK